MKKEKFTHKLSLNKQTITNLDAEQMKKIEGGARPTASERVSLICNTAFYCYSDLTTKL